MPRYYYLFPSYDGPFPNPFPLDDYLFSLSQEAIRVLQEPDEESAPPTSPESDSTQDFDPEAVSAGCQKQWDAEQHKRWKTKLYFICLETCRIAFVNLVNRVLTSNPPTEAHWDFASIEAARRAIAVAFYIRYEAFGERLPYAEKRSMEVLLTEWLRDAKSIWRARVLNPACQTSMVIFPEPTWHLPKAATWLNEQLWEVDFDDSNPPSHIKEELFRPNSFNAVDEVKIHEWIEVALRDSHILSESVDFDQQGGKLENTRIISHPQSKPRFPARGVWLKQRLLERGWGNSDSYLHGGPDRKTIEKILRGEMVRNDVLKKLADSLSKQNGTVTVHDIPGE